MKSKREKKEAQAPNFPRAVFKLKLIRNTFRTEVNEILPAVCTTLLLITAMLNNSYREVWGKSHARDRSLTLLADGKDKNRSHSSLLHIYVFCFSKRHKHKKKLNIEIINNNYSMSPSWIWSDKITNERVARVAYNHFISNKGEWNNCFSKSVSNRDLPPIFISTILQSVRTAENY